MPVIAPSSRAHAQSPRGIVRRRSTGGALDPTVGLEQVQPAVVVEVAEAQAEAGEGLAAGAHPDAAGGVGEAVAAVQVDRVGLPRQVADQ